MLLNIDPDGDRQKLERFSGQSSPFAEFPGLALGYAALFESAHRHHKDRRGVVECLSVEGLDSILLIPGGHTFMLPLLVEPLFECFGQIWKGRFDA